MFSWCVGLHWERTLIFQMHLRITNFQKELRICIVKYRSRPGALRAQCFQGITTIIWLHKTLFEPAHGKRRTLWFSGLWFLKCACAVFYWCYRHAFSWSKASSRSLLHVREQQRLARLSFCTGSSEPLLVACVNNLVLPIRGTDTRYGEVTLQIRFYPLLKKGSSLNGNNLGANSYP